MKKIIMILAGIIMAATAITACGTDTKETTQKQNNGFVEVEVETVIIEQIITESTITERIYVDNEYSNELNYNSKTNNWDDNPNITYWD